MNLIYVSTNFFILLSDLYRDNEFVIQFHVITNNDNLIVTFNIIVMLPAIPDKKFCSIFHGFWLTLLPSSVLSKSDERYFVFVIATSHWGLSDTWENVTMEQMQ